LDTHADGAKRADPLGGGAENSSGVLRQPIAPDLMGTAVVTPTGDIEAGSWNSFTLIYTAGAYGIDDSGGLRVCFRFASDQTAPQFDNPNGANYTTVEASNGAVLQCRFDPKGNVRPWDKTLYIKVVKGYLLPGDTITVRFGVTKHGGPGMRIQTFCEESYEFRVLVDPIATFNYQPVPVQPTIRIVPGPPARYVATLPSRRRVGEKFALHLKGEDRWGNPSDRCAARLALRATGTVHGLPPEARFAPGARWLRLAGLTADTAETIEISLVDPTGATVCVSNPLEIVETAELLPFWADLHGQSEETIGTGSARDYFAFARDLGPVDAISHQGNDFQITNEFWAHLDHLTDEFEAPGAFLAVPGYEWSGNTGLGGDRNVFFPETGRQIRRSSHALIEDRSDIGTDADTARELFDAFAANNEWDVVCYAHCGGRYADIRAAHDGRFEKSVEVHSSWGTFEWLVHDAFDLGYRVGIVANSDGHKGRPGASYPGASMFGAIGGLTCFLLPELTREALFACLRKRHHYATTGGPAGRPVIDLTASFSGDAQIHHDDPALGPSDAATGRMAMMGDIVRLPDGECDLSVHVRAVVPIERLDIFNGRNLVHTARPYGEADLGGRIRLVWEGAEYRGRFRQVIWDGHAEITGNEIVAARPINFFNPDRALEIEGTTRASWKALTTGNTGGVDLWLKEGAAGRLSIDTPLVETDIDIAEIGYDDTIFDRSDVLPRYLKVFRLPESMATNTLDLTYRVPLHNRGDNPIFIRLTQEDGTIAWTSPIYIFR
jgi:hypothetical protein